MGSKQSSDFSSSTLDFNTHLKNSEVNFWYWDLEKDYMTWSRGSFNLFEMEPCADNMLSHFMKQLQEEKKFNDRLEEFIVGVESTFVFQQHIKTIKGNDRWVEINGEIIRKGDQAMALFGVCHDVSHLRQSAIELKTVQSHAKIGFWHWTENNGVYWSRAIREMTEIPDGVAAPEYGDWLRNYVHEDDRDRVDKEIKERLAVNKPLESKYKQVSYKGNIRTVRSIGIQSPLDKNKIIGTVQDITEESRIQNELKDQSKLFDEILQTMIVGVAKVNMDGVITFANEAAMNYLEDRKMVGRYHMSDDIDQIDTDGNVIPSEEMPFARTLRSGEIVSSFKHGLFINKKLKWFSVNSSPLMQDDVQVGAIANFIEITDEVETQRKLMESEERYRLIAENTGDLISLFNPDGSYIYVSPNVKDLRGYTAEEILNHSLFEHIYPDDIPSIKTFYDKVLGGENVTLKYRYEHKNGDVKWYQSTTQRIADENNELKYVQITSRLIHDQKLAEDQLIESEQKFKALAENLPGVIYLSKHDGNFNVTYVNDEVKRVTGYSKRDFIEQGVTLVSIIHPEDLDVNHEKQKKALRHGKSFTLEYRLKKKSGDWIWVKDTGAGVKDENGDIKFVEGYLEDITESKKITDETKLNEQRFRILFNDSGHGIGIADGRGIFLDANRRFLDQVEYSLEELQGKKTFLDLTHPEDQEIGHKELMEMMSGKISSYQVEKRYVSKSGREIYFRVNVSHFLDPGTGEIRLVGTADDITESKLAAEKIKLNERKFRSLFENAANAILITNASGLIVEMNKEAEQLLGYSKNEIEGIISVDSITKEDDLSQQNDLLKKLLKGESRSITSENRYITKLGETFWVQENISTYAGEVSGEPMIVRIIEDITERRKFIREIQASELKFRSVFEEAGHGVAITDQEGYLLTTNKKFRQILGLSKLDILSRVTALDYVHPDYIEDTVKQFKLLQKDHTTTVQTEAKYRTKKGKTIWIRLNGSGYLDPISNEVRLVGIIEDITRRKDAVEKLELSEEFQHETINSLSIALMVMKTDGKIEQTNTVWDKIISNSKRISKAKKGSNFLDLLENIAAGPGIQTGLKAVINDTSELLELEISLDSKGKWFAIRASKLNPAFDSLVITLQEITVRKRVEQALEESLSKYRNIYNMTPVMMHSIDQKGILLSVSDFWLEKLGYQRHEVIGKNLRDFLTPESKKDADYILPEFFDKGSIYDVSYQFVTKDGVILETLLSAIEEGRGTSSPRSLAVVNDVTPLKQAERQLRRSRQDLEEAQFIAQLGSFELHLKDNVFTSSEVFDSILELENINPKDPKFLTLTTPPEDYDRASDLFTKALSEKGLFEYVGQAVTQKSKKKIWIEVLGKVIKEHGKPTKFVGTMQDITRNKTAELKIKELSERLSLATKAARIGVWEEDLKNQKMIWDDEVRKIFYGVKSENYTDYSAVNISHPEDAHIMEDVLKRLNKGEELIDYSRRIIVKNEIKHIQVIVRQIFDQKNKATRRVGIVRDVTQDKLLMKQLENSLEEKDILIKEVHHRVKNNMQMISSILALKSLDLTDQDSKNVFDDCTTRIKSMAVVHDQLYRFYNVSEIDISEYLNYLLSGLHTLMGGNAGNFIIDIHADEYKMNVDQALLCGLIISEMVANAFKHGFKHDEEGIVKVEFLVRKDKKQLIVTNTGSPIPKDILEVRTTSLGMSLIKTFVTQLEGTIEIHPKNGLQVTF